MKVKITSLYGATCRFSRLLALKLREEDKVKHMVWSFFLTLAGGTACESITKVDLPPEVTGISPLASTAPFWPSLR